MTARLPEDETAGEFEQRGVELARALHDPSGVQGSLMINGRERDGVFVSHEDINAYEFTLLRTKDKAEKDAAKLVEWSCPCNSGHADTVRLMTPHYA
ncbi:hypothetical protein [Burkholderia multivorans]|uniref:hypothetical protein n=1 Tax=Burkholderia multivorans TaxID=87883 RepID=UPI0021586CF4|nr:hypothetical protein [Burkholderia multivorans]